MKRQVIPKDNSKTMESWMLKNGKAGDVFYTWKSDKDMTALASISGRKIKTERRVVINRDFTHPEIEPITRVTLLNDSPALIAEVINQVGKIT